MAYRLLMPFASITISTRECGARAGQSGLDRRNENLRRCQQRGLANTRTRSKQRATTNSRFPTGRSVDEVFHDLQKLGPPAGDETTMSTYNRSVVAVTNRSLCTRPFLEQVERVCAFQPAALILREKDLDESAYEALAADVLAICKRHQVPCILHSFLDVAKRLGVKQIQLPPVEAGRGRCGRQPAVGQLFPYRRIGAFR